ncbi:MAG: InlB B-repeat-containing protein [Clostridiales bacterium]|jgi:uncharacterized repeat protein (TIGR02543 family)|nr:InlB B-repeat-containing protein [Clostridiales bacterium]
MKRKLTVIAIALALILGAFATACASEPTRYTVRFVTNTAAAADDQTVEKGGTVAEPQNLTKEGYTQDGWYENAQFSGGKAAFPYSPTDNITLYLKWNVNSYTVGFEVGAGTPIPDMTKEYGSVIDDAPTTTREHSRIKEWRLNSADGAVVSFPYAVPASDVTLYAVWEMDSYTVEFVSYGGNVSGSKTVEALTEIELATPESAQYPSFLGWYDNEGCEGGPIESPYTVIGNVTLYARWTVVVTLFLDGGAPKPDPESPIRTGDDVYTLAAPGGKIEENLFTPWVEKEYYTVEGWYYAQTLAESQRVTFPLATNVNRTLYVKWEGVPRAVAFNIGDAAHFEDNASYGGIAVANNQLQVPHGTVLNKNLLPSPTHNDAAKVFRGWFLDNGFFENVPSNYVVTGDVPFYAEWGEAQLLNFDARGGSPVAPIAVPLSGGAVYAEPLTQKDSAGFAGWYEDLSDAEPVRFPYAVPAGDGVTLYAKWETSYYTVAFDMGADWEGGAVEPLRFARGYVWAAAPQYTKADGSFAYWFTDGALKNRLSFPYTVGANATFHAKWEDKLVFTAQSDGSYAVKAKAGAVDIYVPAYYNGSPVVIQDGTVTADGFTANTSAFFASYTTLKFVVLEEGITYIGAGAFYVSGSESSLIGVVLPSTVKSIGAYAFHRNQRLASIALPDGLLNIGAMAFYECYNLSHIFIPSSVDTIGAGAFGRASSGNTTRVYVPFTPDRMPTGWANQFEDIEQDGSTVYHDQGTYVLEWLYGAVGATVIFGASRDTEDHVTYISVAAQAYYAVGMNHMSLTCIDEDGWTEDTITHEVYIYSYTAANITAKLNAAEKILIGIDDSVTRLAIPEGVTNIAGGAFLGRKNLMSVDAANVTGSNNANHSITVGAFAYAYSGVEAASLQKFTYGDYSDAQIMSQTHQGHIYEGSAVSSISYGGGVAAIGQFMFANCPNLKAVSLPAAVTKLGQYAFYASGVEYAQLANVTTLGAYAFTDCASLKLLEFKEKESGATTVIPANFFSNCADEIAVVLPLSMTGTIASGVFNVAQASDGHRVKIYIGKTDRDDGLIMGYDGEVPTGTGFNNTWINAGAKPYVSVYNSKTGWDASYDAGTGAVTVTARAAA